MTAPARRRRALVIHPSDEMYGADRVLLETIDAAPDDIDIQVWLPIDVDYPHRALTQALRERGILTRHVDLPILRRAYLKPSRLPALAVRLVKAGILLARARPDLLYLNTAASSLLAPVGRLTGAAVVLHLHEYLTGATRIVLPFVCTAQRIVAVSEAIVTPLPRRVSARTRVVHNGFDLPRPVPLPPLDGPLRIVLASRWNAWKGHRLLLEAWGRTTRTDLELVVLGSAPPSGDAVDVPTLVARTPGHDRITIVGQSDDVRTHLDAAHVVAVPSVQADPLPTIAIEALAAGRSLVASDTGGLPEILGPLGRLVATGDVDAWTRALEELDADRVRTDAEQGRARFDALFSRERFAAAIGEHLWSVR